MKKPAQLRKNEGLKSCGCEIERNFFFVFLIFSVTTYAQKKSWMVEYFENGQTVFELFETATDGWQDKKGRWTFQDADKANIFRSKNQTYLQ